MQPKKGSEAAVAAGVPLRAVEGFFDGVSRISPLRVQYNDDKVAEIESQIRLEQARVDIAAAAEAREAARNESYGYSMSRSFNVDSPPQAEPITVVRGGTVTLSRQTSKLFEVTVAAE